jgi:hypothetical protein
MVVLAARTTGVASKDHKPSVLLCGVRRDGFCEFCSNGKASGFRGFSRVLRLIGSVKFLGAGRADERRGRDAFENWGCDFFPNHAQIKSRPGADDLVPNPEPDLAVLRNQFKREIFSLAPGKALIVVML